MSWDVRGDTLRFKCPLYCQIPFYGSGLLLVSGGPYSNWNFIVLGPIQSALESSQPKDKMDGNGPRHRKGRCQGQIFNPPLSLDLWTGPSFFKLSMSFPCTHSLLDDHPGGKFSYLSCESSSTYFCSDYNENNWTGLMTPALLSASVLLYAHRYKCTKMY